MKTGDIPIHAAEVVAEQKITELASRRAAADPFPGPLEDAFCSGPIEVAGKKVYKVIPRYWQALKVLKSPLLSMIQDVVQSGKNETEFTDEQTWEICWIFTHTGKEVAELLKQGVEAFRATVEAEVGDSEFPVNLVFAAAMQQIKGYISTMVKQAAESEEKGDLRFFRDSATPLKVETVGS